MARPQRVVPKAEVIPERPRRPVVDCEPSGPYGGWMKNPPSSCEKKKLDKEGYWAETVICAYYCKVNINCPCYKLLMEGAKERKKFKEEVEEVEVPKPAVQNSRRRLRT